MLHPKSVAHLLFRNTVAESFEAVAAGQATYAVVPYYNSITQTDGATLKALATGGFEVFAQVCMPTSYVLVAHTDYIDEFLQTYTSIKELGEDPSPEDKAKIYTRFLTRIYVGAHADEQYRGRLIRPDLKNSTVELSRNPLRVLEELSRSDQMTQMMKVGRDTRQEKGIYLGGGQQVLVRDTVQAPAALVAAGLLDAPGDPEGWDQPGSLGEIVALLRKLLVLLNVYSFGAPDLPENTTQYLLVGRRGDTAPPKDALKLPATVTTRIMTMVRPAGKKSSADQWLKPFNDLSRIARQHGFVFDRAPVTVSSAKSAAFLYEGGKLKDGALLSPFRLFDWLFGESTSFVGGKDRTLRKMLEKKPSDKPDAPGNFNRYFLGEYPSWCYGVNLKPGETSRCCDEPHDTVAAPTDVTAPFFQYVIATLVTLTALGLMGMLLYCPLTGACGTPLYQPQDMRVLQPPSEPPTTPPQTPPALAPDNGTKPPVNEPAQPYPGLNHGGPTKPPVSEPAAPAYPGLSQPPKQEPKPSSVPLTPVKPSTVPAQPSRIEAARPQPVFHVAFFQGKANLTTDAMNALASAASQVLQMNRQAKIRVVSLGPKEDDELWQRRRLRVEDELVRQGVPRNQITSTRAGSQLIITLRPAAQPAPAPGKRAALELDTVADPLMGDY
jgi:outer membrane protein OmpA-like peptidoglycan-associated protein